MKKRTFSIMLLFFFVFLFSCKKCKVCDCYKNGISKEEENCEYVSTGKSNLDTWEKYLKQNGDYDSVRCHAK